MEAYTFFAMGEYIVAADDKKILFSKNALPKLTSVGDTMFKGKKLVIKTFADNTIEAEDAGEISPDMFTESMPTSFIKLVGGPHYAICFINDEQYITIPSITADYCYYTPNSFDIKIIDTKNKPKLVLKRTSIEDKSRSTLIPKFTKIIHINKVIVDDSISCQIIYIDSEMYFISGSYISKLYLIGSGRVREFILSGCKTFYVSQSESGLELIASDGSHRVHLSKQCEAAARQPGFGQLVQISSEGQSVDAGKNKINNLVFHSKRKLKNCHIFSTVNPDGQEIVFGVDVCGIVVFKHEYLRPTSTKSAISL